MDIDFETSSDDSFIHPHYVAFCSLIDRETSGTFTANLNIKLIYNFVTDLFIQMEVRKHDTILDRIDLGIMSTSTAILKFPKLELKYFKTRWLQIDEKLARKYL